MLAPAVEDRRMGCLDAYPAESGGFQRGFDTCRGWVIQRNFRSIMDPQAFFGLNGLETLIAVEMIDLVIPKRPPEVRGPW